MTCFAQTAYAGLCRLLHRLPGACDIRLHCIVAIEPQRLRIPARLPREMLVRWLDPVDEPALLALRPALGVPYAARFAEGHRCAGAFLPGGGGLRLVAFVWVLHGPARMPTSFGCAWDVSSTMAWLYDLHSSPGVLGALPHLYLFMRRNSPRSGCLHWLGQNDFENLRSRMAHLSLGFNVCALLWSLRCGSWYHLSRSRTAPHWRRHGEGSAIPLPLFLAPASVPRDALPFGRSDLRLQCTCGAAAALLDGVAACSACGRVLGREHDGVLDEGAHMSYWGEVPQAAMQALLQRARAEGWRSAVAASLPPSLHRYVTAPDRAAFHEILPVAAGARLLDVGAGWGSIAVPLARQYQVVALEGVAERAQFIALRQQQDHLERLTVVRGEIHGTNLAPHQFDAIIANGVLEWSALQEWRDPPRAVQLRFLVRLRELLGPGGCLYVGIENRFGWAMLRGGTDHSGLRYTSLLPRWAAHRVCLSSHQYRAQANHGYRTYTYSHRGYCKLFAEAGLRVESSWVSPGGYNAPSRLIPLHPRAVHFSASRRDRSPLRAWLHAATWQEPALRWLGSDFVFLLRSTAASAIPAPPVPPEQDRAHA
ncbi:MAG: class I SAM-dependent methyltransferase [Terriglobales bacterium]